MYAAVSLKQHSYTYMYMVMRYAYRPSPPDDSEVERRVEWTDGPEDDPEGK